MNRRNFLKAGSASMMTASMVNMASLLASPNVLARSNNDYKALVCVFLYGGMDNHDTIIPYDVDSYQQWANIRSSLLSQYSQKRDISSLLPIATSAQGRFGTRKFALPPEMSGLHQLYQQGKAAVVGNVGPLLAPTNATAFNAQTVPLPSRLFSHNDQQSTWVSGATEGAQFGWGGQLSDELINAGLRQENTFSAITTANASLFITGEKTTPYHLEGGGALTLDILEENDGLAASLAPHLSAENYQANHLLKQDLALKVNQSYSANQLYNDAISSSPASQVEFPRSYIGNQLKAVSRAISARSSLQANRQVFIVAMGGFDTHSGQANSLPKLQSQLDQAILAFDQAMTAMGLNEEVTLFSASDFGRTLAINGDGTDHGWGAHHFVVGGAVNGGRIFGDIPAATFGHEFDAGSGRLIPTSSIEQYAASLGRWMGLNEQALNRVFPNLAQFGQPLNLFHTA